MLKKLLTSFLDALYVENCKCALCGRELKDEGLSFCDACKVHLNLIENCCVRCGTPLPSDGYCPNCKNTHRFFEKNCAAAEYSGRIKDMILKYKFGGRKYLASAMAGLLETALNRLGESADLLVPVPSSPERIKKRGFDHTALLAGKLSLLCGIETSGGVLKRISESKPQIESAKSERLSNLERVFEADKSVEGMSVILVDDVITTGATLNECARALKESGASAVYGIPVAAAEYKINFDKAAEMSEKANIFSD